MLFYRRAVVDDVFFRLCQLPEGHIGAHSHGPAHVGHQRPHQALPRSHSPLINGQGLVGHQGGAVHGADHAGAAAGTAGPLAVKGQLLRAGGVKLRPALRALQRLPRRHRQGGRHIVPVGAAVAGQPGVHQTQGVEQLRAGAEGAADAGHSWPLVEGQGGGDVAHVIHIRPGRLGHPSSGIGGQGLQVPPGPLGVQHPQSQGGFPRAGYPGHPHDLVERHVHINIFQVMYPRAPDLDVPGRVCVLSHMNVLPSRPRRRGQGAPFRKSRHGAPIVAQTGRECK